MSDTKTHLARLHSLVGEFKSHSGDEVIGKMLPEFAELVVALGAELDAAQRTMVRLTWAVIALAVIILGVGAAQLYVSASPNQQPSTKHVPSSETPALGQKSPKDSVKTK